MKIRVARADDWMAVWIDGEKIFEHHDFDWMYELKEYDMDIECKWAGLQCDELTGFPATYEEVMSDKEYAAYQAEKRERELYERLKEKYG